MHTTLIWFNISCKHRIRATPNTNISHVNKTILTRGQCYKSQTSTITGQHYKCCPNNYSTKFSYKRKCYIISPLVFTCQFHFQNSCRRHMLLVVQSRLHIRSSSYHDDILVPHHRKGLDHLPNEALYLQMHKLVCIFTFSAYIEQ